MTEQSEGELVLVQLALQCLEDSRVWFSECQQLVESLPYLGLCVSGEVGEFNNIVKKVQRGTLDINDPQVQYDLAMELTDVFIYVLLIAGTMRVNLFQAYHEKRRINAERWGAVDDYVLVTKSDGGVAEGTDPESKSGLRSVDAGPSSGGSD